MSTSGGYKGPLEKVGPCQWRIPKSYRPDMRVDGMIFADDALIEQIRKDQGPEQVANVATLPGIQGASLAMPDIHWGYGFCIGGVAATDPEEGRRDLARRASATTSTAASGCSAPDSTGPRPRTGSSLWWTSSSATSPPVSGRAASTCSTSRS